MGIDIFQVLYVLLFLIILIYLYHLTDIRGKSKIKGIVKDRGLIESYNNFNIDEKFLSISFTLLKNVKGIDIELEWFITAVILKLIKRGKIRVIDKQKDLIFKFNEGFESYDFSVEEEYVIQNLRKLMGEGLSVEMSEIFCWLDNNKEQIHKDFIKIEKVIRKDLEEEGYIGVKFKFKDFKLIRHYYMTDKGNKLIEDLIGLYNYLESIHKLNERLVYRKETWDNYMLWAILYNKERNVRSYLKRINSEYFNSTHLNIGYISLRI